MNGLSDKSKILEAIGRLGVNGESLYFNEYDGGGAVCYFCNGIYLLFEVKQYTGIEVFDSAYGKTSIEKMVDEALSWT